MGKTSPANLRTFLIGNLEDGKQLLTFTAYSPPTINYLATTSRDAILPGNKIEESYTFYFPKNTIREDISHNYAAAEGTFIETLRKGKGWLTEGAKVVEQLQSVGQTLKGIRGGKVAGGKSGVLIEEPSFFTNTEKRKFSIILDLYYLTDIADDIYNPIKFFKKYSHARRLASNFVVPEINFPSTFKISGGVFQTIMPKGRTESGHERGHVLLTGMSVTYGEDMNFLSEDGLPVHAQITLDFEEIMSLYANDWDDDIEITSSEIKEKGIKPGSGKQTTSIEDFEKTTDKIFKGIKILKKIKKVIE